ncbi:DUF222 domain-containing protein [Saccharopolyspora sp. 5N708]|uniref:DUF222 domain-containing protein n=1 Tax=Saccharopolyspora sp. 5N708 TaxID=3457424 RepID=UPI003FD09166
MTPLTDTQNTTAETTPQSAVASCSDDELVGRLRDLEQTMRATMMEQLLVIAEAEHRGLHVANGARSLPAWLRGLLNIDHHDAKTRVRVARNVESRKTPSGATVPAELPETAVALSEGAIGVEHARVIADSIHALPEHARCDQVAVESTLSGYARQMPPRELAKLAERIRYSLDQDGAHRDEQAQYEARELYFWTARDGMTVVKARLDRESGAKFAALLEPLAAPCPEADGTKDPRSAGQRNADAFAAILDLAIDADTTPRAGGWRPRLNITIDFEDLKRGLDSIGGGRMPGTLHHTERAITAESVRRIACDCEVLPMVLDGEGLPLDVGRSKRTAPAHIRAALLQRDGVCSFPGCDRPPGTPDAHHIVSWIDGGRTDLSNMTMLCPHHHRTVHNQRWDITMRDGRPVFIPPATLDTNRTPRPGGRALPIEHRAIIERHFRPSRGHANTPAV